MRLLWTGFYVVTKISLGATNAQGNTSLQIAIVQGNLPCVVSLLKHGAMSLEEDDGSSIMVLGAKSDYLEVMRVLLDKYSDSSPLTVRLVALVFDYCEYNKVVQYILKGINIGMYADSDQTRLFGNAKANCRY